MTNKNNDLMKELLKPKNWKPSILQIANTLDIPEATARYKIKNLLSSKKVTLLVQKNNEEKQK